MKRRAFVLVNRAVDAIVGRLGVRHFRKVRRTIAVVRLLSVPPSAA